MKVQCTDCEHYNVVKELETEPKGFCLNDEALPFGVYLGTNWRSGQRFSKTVRYCKFYEAIQK